MKPTTEKLLITEHTEKIALFKTFLKDVQRAVNDALLAYEGLGISSKLTLNELSSIEHEGLERTIKKKMVQAMPETQLAGIAIDKKKYIEMAQLPDLSTMKAACTELFDIVNSFQERNKNVDSNRVGHWSEYITNNTGKTEIDSPTVEEDIDRIFRVYLSGKQIPLYKALKEITAQLNTGVLPEMIADRRYILIAPYSDPREYMVSWERFFKDMLLFNGKKNQFEVKHEFVLKY